MRASSHGISFSETRKENVPLGPRKAFLTPLHFALYAGGQTGGALAQTQSGRSGLSNPDYLGRPDCRESAGGAAKGFRLRSEVRACLALKQAALA